MYDQELDAFKQEIDLRQFAASLGYKIDKRESWRGSTVLRRGADKIIVKRNSNGHYVFFSVRDDRDNGTIIDFLQAREHLNLGAVRKVLRPWIGRPALSLYSRLEPTSKDRMRVESEYRRMATASRHPYLEHQRRIPADVLSSRRFLGRVRIDDRGNAVFPHFDRAGLCGYELKNQKFTGFAAGGEKGLWFSHLAPGDRRLVLAESAIDALSYAALFPDVEDKTRYASLGGTPNSKQPDLIESAVTRLPDESEVIAAFDADEAGRSLLNLVRLAVERAARALVFTPHLPAPEDKDWNQVLQNRHKAPNRLPNDASGARL